MVHRLSKRFTSFGGYYTYAMHLLSERFGFQTGWMYLYFSILFGSAYVIGATYVINYVFGISPVLVALAITLPAFIFLIFGIKPTAKYAIFAGIIEIAVLASFFLFSIYFSHNTFYSPISYPGAITYLQDDLHSPSYLQWEYLWDTAQLLQSQEKSSALRRS